MKRMSAVDRPHRLATEHKARAYLNIHPQTLAAWRWTGGGPDYLQDGRKVRYRAHDLEHWLDDHARLCSRRLN
jgi:Helix-turn-helix domain